jgi:hypothetical protein
MNRRLIPIASVAGLAAALLLLGVVGMAPTSPTPGETSSPLQVRKPPKPPKPPRPPKPPGGSGKGYDKPCPKLTASIDEPESIKRGEKVKLDGSNSSPQEEIGSYEWIFESPSGAFPKHTTVTSDPSLEVELLETTTVTLRVISKRKDCPAAETSPVDVEVKARTGPKWTTKVAAKDGFTYLPNPVGKEVDKKWGHMTFLPVVAVEDQDEPMMAFVGCARDPIKTLSDWPNAAFHVLHPRDEPGKRSTEWEGKCYELKQITDANSPFYDFWYVSENKIVFECAIYMSPYYAPKGPRPPGASDQDKNWYQRNAAQYGEQCPRGYLDALVQHEATHISLIRDAVSQKDPAKAIERQYRGTGDEAKEKLIEDLTLLLAQADKDLHDASTTLDPKPADDNPLGKSKLWDGKTDRWDGQQWVPVPEKTYGDKK